MAPKLETLRQLRRNAGLTQRQLSDKSGLAETQISKMETGAIDVLKVESGTLFALAAALGCTPQDIMGDAMTRWIPQTERTRKNNA